jgi:hypothetical protein
MNIIEEFRKTQEINLLNDFRFLSNDATNYIEQADLNYENRKNLILTLIKSYSVEDKPLIKWLLNEEIKYSEYISCQITTIEVCTFLLYKYMDLADIQQLYLAKFSNFDNSCAIDAEIILGFDIEETKAYLTQQKINKRLNKKILKTIAYYEKILEEKPNAIKSRPDYINYFENQKIQHLIKNLTN